LTARQPGERLSAVAESQGLDGRGGEGRNSSSGVGRSGRIGVGERNGAGRERGGVLRGFATVRRELYLGGYNGAPDRSRCTSSGATPEAIDPTSGAVSQPGAPFGLTAAARPGGDRLLLAQSGGQLAVANADGSGTPQAVAGITSPGFCMRESLDGTGTALTYLGANGHIRYIPLAAGAKVDKDLGLNAYDPQLSPDGRWIADSTSIGAANLIHPDGTDSKTLNLPGLHGPVRWFPDSRRLAYLGSSPSSCTSAVTVADTVTGATTSVPIGLPACPTGVAGSYFIPLDVAVSPDGSQLAIAGGELQCSPAPGYPAGCPGGELSGAGLFSQSQIIVMPVGGGTPRVVRKLMGSCNDPANQSCVDPAGGAIAAANHAPGFALYSLFWGKSSDHYDVELKAWIPHAAIVNPAERVPYLLSFPNPGTCFVKAYGVSAFGPGFEFSTFSGDDHVRYTGSGRITVRVGFDWNGARMSNITSEASVAANLTRRNMSYMNLGSKKVFRCVDVMQAKSAASSKVSASSVATLDIHGANPFFNFFGLSLAPTIDSTLTARFIGPQALKLSWDTDQFPSHGFLVQKNGSLLYERVTRNAYCVPAYGVVGAATLFVLLNSKTNHGSTIVQTNGTPTVAPLPDCRFIPPPIGISQAKAQANVSANAQGRVTLPNVAYCGSRRCTLVTTARSQASRSRSVPAGSSTITLRKGHASLVRFALLRAAQRRLKKHPLRLRILITLVSPHHNTVTRTIVSVVRVTAHR
jgi:hypothetical protein